MSTGESTRDNSSPPLALHLFGPIEIHVHGVPLARLHSRKGLWLLALLALRQGPAVERDWLVGALWPDTDHSQGLDYLRHSLTELRRALATEADRLLAPTRQTLTLDLAGAEVDVLAFDADIRHAEPAALQHAVEIYRGPLLEGCAEEWALPERANREQSFLMALQRLADDALTHGEVETAIRYARRAIRVDPLQEGAQRTLIQALVAAGDYGAATQVYRDLRLHLHRELHAEPDPETTALYNQLRAQTRQKAQAVREVVPSLSTSPPPRRLPRPLTDLLGRDEEVLQIAMRLRQHRLVTLTGIGGVGKTRLAIALAEALVEEYADGAWFVDLASISDADRVVQTIATTLGVRDEPGRSLQEVLVSFLRPRVLLLVLDNCEHLLQACALVAADLLYNCVGLRILATSRQALGVTGEVNWQVPSLPIPDRSHLPDEPAELLASVSGYASVQLFVERAEAMQKAFGLTAHNALAIARICERLDGIPLAIELAAGNVRALSIEQIAQRLDDVFRLLTRGNRAALPRQQTLRATLDWSYDLLTEPERSLLQRLSVFAGGWTLEAAEMVAGDSWLVDGKAVAGGSALVNDKPITDHQPGSPNHFGAITSHEILDLLTSLVDKSLVIVEDGEGAVRYRMLEPVRQYARDRLLEVDDALSVRESHRDYFLAFAEEIGPKLRGAEQAQWLSVLEAEHDNLRQALVFCREEPESGEAGLHLGAALWRFWQTHGHLSEGYEYLKEALEHRAAQEPTKARADALNGAGNLAWSQGDYAAARSLYEESLTIKRELGDKRGIAASLGNLGNVTTMQGDYATARSLYEESLTIKRELGDKQGIASSLNNLGNVVREQGDYAAARALQEESLAITRELGDKHGMANAVRNLGNVAIMQGDYAAARALQEESLAIARELGDKHGIADSLGNLGEATLAQGDYASARSLQKECLAIRQELGDKKSIANSLEAYAHLALKEQQAKRSVRLWGAAQALRAAIGSPLPPDEREMYESQVTQARSALGETVFAAAWEEGSAMTLEQAIDDMLGGGF